MLRQFPVANEEKTNELELEQMRAQYELKNKTDLENVS
jgi:hypothetical protein